jgi:WD40 repeat protein
MALRQITGKDLDYQFIQVIGNGGFGTVSKVRRVKDGRIMACKSIDCSTYPELEKLAAREIEAWASFGTEKYIAAYSNDSAWNPSTKTIRIYMDYYEGGDLQRVIDICRHEETTIHPIMATYWAVEISRGIKACHDHGIIHRDIKPQNILLSIPYIHNDILWSASNDNTQKLRPGDYTLAREFLEWMNERTPWCHLTDFGLGKFSTGAMMSRNTNASYGMVGTPGYIAPESLGENPVFSSRSDVYSFGCLLYTLCKCSPLPSLVLPDTAIPSIPGHYPRKLQFIIAQCLQEEPSRRPSSREVLNDLSEVYLDLVMSSFWTKTKIVLDSSNGRLLDKAPWQSSPVISNNSSNQHDLQAGEESSFLPTAAPKILEGHSSNVKAMVFSPDGKTLASASGDKTIRLWNGQSGAALVTLKGHLDYVQTVVFSPDGKTLASASSDKTIRLWDSQSGATLKTLEGHSSTVSAIVFSPDGKTLASASWDKTIKLWNGQSGAALKTLKGHSSLVETVVFSPDGKTLASASSDKTIRLWDSQSGAALKIHEGHSGSYFTVVFSPDGKTLASVSGNTIRLWNGESGEALKTWNCHSSSIFAIAFSPDSETLASASDDTTIMLWNRQLGALVRLKGHSSYVCAVAFSPNSKVLASGSHDKTIRLWDSQSGATLKILKGHSSYVDVLVFSPDGKTLASASGDNTIRLWE